MNAEQFSRGTKVWFKGDRDVCPGFYEVVEDSPSGKWTVVLNAGPINLWTVSKQEVDHSRGAYDQLIWDSKYGSDLPDNSA